LLDTKGPEIRTGFFANDAKKIDLKKGASIILTSDYTFLGDAKKLACSYTHLATSVTNGQQILVADGSLVLTVLTTDPSSQEITCRIENNTSIGERKNMNLPGVKVDLPTFTEKDVKDIVDFGIARRVEFIAASFVRTGQDVRNLKKLLADNGGPEIKIISKIENQEGLENYDDILKETDGVMVARGDVSTFVYRLFCAIAFVDCILYSTKQQTHPDSSDSQNAVHRLLFLLLLLQLGMEIPASKVFLAQKFMIRKANLAGKPVITATQMLESMITNPRPTRAECSDVANSVYDGTDAVMLSGETGMYIIYNPVGLPRYISFEFFSLTFPVSHYHSQWTVL
jgi:pyruvate kinase